LRKYNDKLLNESKSDSYDLNVYITHFIPPKPTTFNLLKSFIAPRFSIAYLRSWARLVKHGTRGNQPWKKDVMTKSRKKDQANRMIYLSRLIESLSNLRVNSLKINIFTNSQEASRSILEFGFSANLKFYVFSKYNKMNQFHNSPWIEDDPNSPWNLVWEHKDLLEKDFQEGTKKSLYLYIENDLLFRQANLEYWLEERKELKSMGLIPSFMLVEFDPRDEMFVAINTFTKDKIKISDLSKVDVKKSYFIELPNPYTGLYLLDQQLLKEHISSKAFSKVGSRDLIWWDLGARATSGNQFIEVPTGFTSRHVIKLDRKSLVPADGVLVHHMPNLYRKTSKLDLKALSLYEIFI
jgi:hypothetical protein